MPVRRDAGPRVVSRRLVTDVVVSARCCRNDLLVRGGQFLLATIVNSLLGWNIWLSTFVAAAIVLSYISLGGLSAAIYNEVLQFFVIIAALVPLVIVALHDVGGWGGLTDKFKHTKVGEAGGWDAATGAPIGRIA